MRPPRLSRVVWAGAQLGTLALAAALASCGAARPPTFASAEELPPTRRHPDGVAVDPATELPPAAEAAPSDAAIATLREPLPSEAAREVLRAFFRAVVAEDFDALAALVTSDATMAQRTRGSAALLLDVWRARMRRLDYLPLASAAVYDDATVETWRASDLGAPSGAHPARPPEMTAGDLMLRVPVAVTRSGQERLFGDEMTFLLRRDGSRFRIRTIVEDFQLP